ncbi:MAG: hypothetical protein LBR58_04865 [Propionibacteriaceae bacterium]|jgi:DNA-directed RNA polymerase specialized sigma24 family protein|nr:hypothetical protein [Propionibacteriaceae bacterium]
MDEFAERYRSLAVAACEWRAFELGDPEALAEDALRRARKPDLKGLYQAIGEVVSEAYRRAASKKPLFAIFQNISPKIEYTTMADLAAEALRNLRVRDADVLRHAYWDGLTVAEIEEITGRPAAKVEAELATALANYAARLQREMERHPVADAEPSPDPVTWLKTAKPGEHWR